MKKTFVSALIAVLLFGCVSFMGKSVSNASSFDIVEAKQNLAAKYKDEKKNLSEDQISKRSKEMEDLLNHLYTSDTSKDEINKQLEEQGLVELEQPPVIQPFSAGNDVSLNAPVIYFDKYTNNWYVTANGSWKNTNWFGDITNVWAGYVGETKNVGPTDAIGVTFFNTSGSYTTKVTSSSALITDGGSWTASYTNPKWGTGVNGTAFEIQDKIKLNRVPLLISASDCSFLGKNFSVTITYDSKFSNYHGYARTLYTHTWSSTYIDSIKFGVSGKTFGADVVIKNGTNSFTIFNGADTVF